jgi:hypothetical protein
MTNSIPLPCQDDLKANFEYNPETGQFYWKLPKKGVVVGQPAGYKDRKGYTWIRFQRKLYLAHRLVWMYTYGEDPGESEIDHINNVPSDNRLENLRLASHSQNSWNRPKRVTNSTGFKGVFHTKYGDFYSEIKRDGVKVYLGVFKTPEEAHAAYCQAADQLHGDFANHT